MLNDDDVDDDDNNDEGAGSCSVIHWKNFPMQSLQILSSAYNLDGNIRNEDCKQFTSSAFASSSMLVKHPALKREDRLGKDPFAGFGTVVEDITESGYTKNQPILLGPFWENAFFVFLYYKIKQKTSQNRAKIPLNITSEGLKYPPEVGVQHETCSTICGTHVQAILNQKNLTGLAGVVREDQNRSKYCPE